MLYPANLLASTGKTKWKPEEVINTTTSLTYKYNWAMTQRNYNQVSVSVFILCYCSMVSSSSIHLSPVARLSYCPAIYTSADEWSKDSWDPVCVAIPLVDVSSSIQNTDTQQFCRMITCDQGRNGCWNGICVNNSLARDRILGHHFVVHSYTAQNAKKED